MNTEGCVQIHITSGLWKLQPLLRGVHRFPPQFVTITLSPR